MAEQWDAMREIAWKRDGGIVELTLNRAERRNALTRTMLAELLWAVEACSEDASVRVVVIRGAGTGFCAGDELRGMGDVPEDFPFQPKAPVTHAALQAALRGMPKPAIASLHGFAFGVGLDLAMACDFRFAADDAQLRDQRVFERGMHAVTGCAWFQPRALGLTRALDFLILGTPYSGAEAAAAGMVTASVPAVELDAAVGELARKLANAPTKAIGLMKRQIYTGLEMSHEQFMSFAAPLIRDVVIEDRAEGVQAFLERRPARFTGR